MQLIIKIEINVDKVLAIIVNDLTDFQVLVLQLKRSLNHAFDGVLKMDPFIIKKVNLGSLLEGPPVLLTIIFPAF